MNVETKRYIAGLREIADWYEAHPEIPVPPNDLNVTRVSTREHAAAVLKALSPCKKIWPKAGNNDPDGFVYITRDFGPITLKFCFYRREVCERVVVGTETIPEHVLPAKEAEVIPESTKEIVEWVCKPMLEDAA